MISIGNYYFTGNSGVISIHPASHSLISLGDDQEFFTNYLIKEMYKTGAISELVIFDSNSLGSDFIAANSLIAQDLLPGQIFCSYEEIQKQLKALLSDAQRKVCSTPIEFDSFYDFEMSLGREQPLVLIVLSLDDEAYRRFQNDINTLIRTRLKSGYVFIKHNDQFESHQSNVEINTFTMSVQEFPERLFPELLLDPKMFTKDNFISYFQNSLDEMDDTEPIEERGLKVQVGHYASSPFYFDLQHKNSTTVHALVCGGTGSGKSVFLSRLILNLMRKYNQVDVELYLVDLKENLAFRKFADAPHVKLNLGNEDQKRAIRLLQGACDEIETRGQLFRKHEVDDILSLYDQGEIHIPRIVIVIDEFQKIYAGLEYSSKKQVNDWVDDIARRGRSFGIHLILASQSFSDSELDSNTRDQFSLRVAFNLSPRESQFFLKTDNAAGLNASKGEAIYTEDFKDERLEKRINITNCTKEEVEEYINSCDVSTRLRGTLEQEDDQKNETDVVVEKEKAPLGSVSKPSVFEFMQRADIDNEE